MYAILVVVDTVQGCNFVGRLFYYATEVVTIDNGFSVVIYVTKSGHSSTLCINANLHMLKIRICKIQLYKQKITWAFVYCNHWTSFDNNTVIS